jgi:hypothetical protein
MTRDQDIERVLERWFSEGPTQMPDRLFEFVDHIDRLPQRPRARSLTRFAAMNSTLRIAAAAVAILFLAGAGTVFLTRPAGVSSQPSPTPSAVPSVSASPAFLPAPVRAKWIYKGTRTSAGLASLAIGSERISIKDPDGSVVSTASLVGPDGLALELHADDWGCQQGDEGTYTYVLSADGNTLTLTPATDVCSTRSDILAGDWARTACASRDGWCLGPLQPGTHTSGLFNPLSSTSTAYTYGQVSYTVPAGWVNAEDRTGDFRLSRPIDPVNSGIYMFRDVVPHSQDESCPETAAPGVERTPEAFADWLSTLPGLVTTAPRAIEVGGLSGFMVDLSVDPAWTHTCPYSQGTPMVSTFTDSDPAPGYDWNVGAGGQARYVFLQQPDGRSLLLDIETSDKAAWDGLLAEAMPIVESLQFNP